ncbi:hypothetical protein [Fodinicola feengrottensis]|uniref:Uncharacterized protein n=1 Tax=Fodinicola feengrottensis TaxID=435914 RepID=A0ABN2IKC9_9ACTN|nr:hypothetical protein [Fodinicola feengrottensis]
MPENYSPHVFIGDVMTLLASKGLHPLLTSQEMDRAVIGASMVLAALGIQPVKTPEDQS